MLDILTVLFTLSSRKDRVVKVHKTCTIQQKLDALEFAKEFGDADAAFSFNTTRKSIRDWRKQESELKEMVGDKQGRKKRLRGGGRPIKHPELEILLPSWIKEQRKHSGTRVTIKNTVKKGNLLLKAMGRDKEVKYGAIWRMKDRNGLALRRKSSENQYIPDDLIPKCQ